MKLLLGFSMLLAAFLAGCSTPESEAYTIGDSGQTLNLDVGDSILLKLEVNTALDQRWHITQLDKGVVKLVGEPEPKAYAVTGGWARMYDYFYTFKAVGPGTTTLHMQLSDPDGGNVAEDFELEFVVTK